MAHILPPPHPFLTVKPIGLDSASSKMVQDSFFRINDYSNSVGKCDEDKPLDFSKKKHEPSLSHHREETYESSNLSEHRQYSKSTSIRQKEITESRNTSPHCISPINSMLVNNSQSYTAPPAKTLMEEYIKVFNKYSPIFPKQNDIPRPEQSEQDNEHHELAPLCKMIENQSFNGTLVSPIVKTNVTSHGFFTTNRNSSPPLETMPNKLKFHNATAFTPIVLSPPLNPRVDHRIGQEQITKSPNLAVPEDVSILQRTLTAPLPQHHLDEHTNGQRNAKQTRPFKAYNPSPNPFPTSFHVMPLGVLQDIEEQEYRYQQYMQSFYINKNSKARLDTRPREPIDNQAGSSGDDRRDSPSTSESPPRPPTSDQNKSFENSNDTSTDVQMSSRQAADTSTSPNNNRNVKRARTLPDELKDAAYWERRRKNNEAAKRSRDTRRQKEDFIAMRARFLEDENKNLRLTIAILRQELNTIKCCAAHNLKNDSKDYNEITNSNSLQYFRKH